MRCWGQGLNKSDGEGDGEEKSIPVKRDACVKSLIEQHQHILGNCPHNGLIESTCDTLL